MIIPYLNLITDNIIPVIIFETEKSNKKLNIDSFLVSKLKRWKRPKIIDKIMVMINVTLLLYLLLSRFPLCDSIIIQEIKIKKNEYI